MIRCCWCGAKWANESELKRTEEDYLCPVCLHDRFVYGLFGPVFTVRFLTAKGLRIKEEEDEIIRLMEMK